MPRQSPFKHHRFPRDMILCAVRWYLRYPLSYQDVVDLLAERGVTVDRSTVYRWVQKFGPELTKRTERHLRRASVDWHVDVTCHGIFPPPSIRVRPNLRTDNETNEIYG